MATLTTTDSIPIRQAYVELTTAQVTSLHTTSITIVPAPGGGKIAVPIGQAYVGLNYNSVAFTGSGNIRVGNNTNYFYSIGNTFLNSSTTHRNLLDINEVATDRLDTNDAIEIFSSAAISTGDSTVTVILNYTIIDQ